MRSSTPKNGSVSYKFVLVTKPNPEERNASRKLARILLKTYDKDRDGKLNEKEVSSMMIDGYKSVNPYYKPSKVERESYMKMLDKNNDGRITLEDLEESCMRFLSNKK